MFVFINPQFSPRQKKTLAIIGLIMIVFVVVVLVATLCSLEI